MLALSPYESKLGCLPCHVDQLGGAGTAVQPFAQTLAKYGIDGRSSAGDLRSALERLGDEDSDGDGVPDLEELLSGGDPNHSACGPGVEVLEYEYGCANLPARPRRAFDAGWLGLVAVSWGRRWLSVRRRTTPQRRTPP